MPRPEEIELKAYRPNIVGDVRKLVEKYRAIFDWDIPEVDQAFADRLILAEIRSAIDEVERRLDETKKL